MWSLCTPWNLKRIEIGKYSTTYESQYVCVCVVFVLIENTKARNNSRRHLNVLNSKCTTCVFVYLMEKKVIQWDFLELPYKTQTKLKDILVSKSCGTWLNSNCAILLRKKRHEILKSIYTKSNKIFLWLAFVFIHSFSWFFFVIISECHKMCYFCFVFDLKLKSNSSHFGDYGSIYFKCVRDSKEGEKYRFQIGVFMIMKDTRIVITRLTLNWPHFNVNDHLI